MLKTILDFISDVWVLWVLLCLAEMLYSVFNEQIKKEKQFLLFSFAVLFAVLLKIGVFN